MYGSIPSALVQIILRGLFAVLSGPDLSWWHLTLYTAGFEILTGTDTHIWVVDDVGLPHILGAGAYGLFYFNWGRSLGHMAAGAHIVDATTGRRMRTWQKVARGGLHLIVAYPLFWLMLQLVSVGLVLIDRQHRRSLYDWAANTVVIVGQPTEEEPEADGQRGW